MKVDYLSVALVGIVCFVIAVGQWVSYEGKPWFMFVLAAICGVLAFVMRPRD